MHTNIFSSDSHNKSHQKNLLLGIKKQLENIRNSTVTDKDGIRVLMQQLAKVISTTTYSTIKVAGLFLMADLYVTLAVNHPSLNSTNKALNQILMCIQKAQDIIDSTACPSTSLDQDFIKKSNTFGVCAPKQAFELIQNSLIPNLLGQSSYSQSVASYSVFL